MGAFLGEVRRVKIPNDMVVLDLKRGFDPHARRRATASYHQFNTAQESCQLTIRTRETSRPYYPYITSRKCLGRFQLIHPPDSREDKRL